MTGPLVLSVFAISGGRKHCATLTSHGWTGSISDDRRLFSLTKQQKKRPESKHTQTCKYPDVRWNWHQIMQNIQSYKSDRVRLECFHILKNKPSKSYVYTAKLFRVKPSLSAICSQLGILWNSRAERYVENIWLWGIMSPYSVQFWMHCMKLKHH